MGKMHTECLAAVDRRMEEMRQHLEEKVASMSLEHRTYENEMTEAFESTLQKIQSRFQTVLNGNMKQLELEAERINEHVRIIFPRARREGTAAASFSASEAR